MGAVLGLLIGLYFFTRSLRRDREAQGLVVRSKLFSLVWIVSAVAMVILLVLIGQGDLPSLHPAYLVFVPLLWPHRLFRLVFRPLGWTWGAYAVSRLANVTWNLAPKNGAICAALLARLRAKERSRPRRGDAWLQERRPPGPGGGPLVATHLLAEALRAELRGERELARILMQTILYMPQDARNRPDGPLAKEWLLLDAAERGAWDEVREVHLLSRHRRYFGSFLVTAGRALEGEAPRWKLILRWLVCGRWYSTRHLLRHAWQAAGRHGEPREDPGSDLERARGSTISGRRAQDAADAWLRVFEGGTYGEWLEERCEVLGLDSDQAARRLRSSVAEALAELAAATGSAVPVAFAGGLMESELEVALRRVDESLELLQRRRHAEITPLDDPHEDLDAWCRLRRSFEEARRLGASGAALYFQVLGPVWSWAARLHDKRLERPLAQAAFAWLHHWAVQVGDTENEQTLLDNSRLGV